MQGGNAIIWVLDYQLAHFGDPEVVTVCQGMGISAYCCQGQRRQRLSDDVHPHVWHQYRLLGDVNRMKRRINPVGWQ